MPLKCTKKTLVVSAFNKTYFYFGVLNPFSCWFADCSIAHRDNEMKGEIDFGNL